eukprot:TRINITY_DN5989_c0_g1_i7.p1 TRINITY_DN5989_c0_g1~~TRINITY_DN5989_c0_g1_i7.p1  ORF type:complete len:144 (+),score=18.98 TRINITY_DN5989_c0_g1_i7:31-432(+)
MGSIHLYFHLYLFYFIAHHERSETRPPTHSHNQTEHGYHQATTTIERAYRKKENKQNEKGCSILSHECMHECARAHTITITQHDEDDDEDDGEQYRVLQWSRHTIIDLGFQFFDIANSFAYQDLMHDVISTGG